LSEQELKDQIDEAEWSWLKAHAARGAMIIVVKPLDLVRVGEAAADNRSDEIQAWIQQGLLTKPTGEQIRQWDSLPAQRFEFLIVQPFVFVREILLQ
jgi:hypothetical protein